MGSAFGAEPIVGLPLEVRAQLVTVALGRPDLVCHLPHHDCPEEMPHHLSACGRFLHARDEDQR